MIAVLSSLPFVGTWVVRIIAALGSPLAKVGAIVAVVLAIYTAGFIRGKHRAESRCQTAALNSRIAAQAIDLSVAQATAEAHATALRQEQAVVAANEEKIRDYERALAARPSGACTLGPDDVRRLRSLSR